MTDEPAIERLRARLERADEDDSIDDRRAAAVVPEVGGRLTHGSLVAREYGIPAVVAVDGATEALADGPRVRVDGTSGVVELLE